MGGVTKKNKNLGYGKTTLIEGVEIYSGAVIVDSEERAVEILEMMEAASEAIKPVTDFVAEARKQVTEFQRTRNVKVVQLEGHYWRLIQRMSRFWVATKADMPSPRPKGAMSLREICLDKTANGKPLWNFITRRVPDANLIELAVKNGFVTEKEISKAYLEKPSAAYIQRFNGEAIGDEDE